MINLEVKIPENSGPSGHARVIRNFLDVIKGTASPVVTPDDGIDIMRILDGIYASAESGRSVTVAPVAVGV